MTLDEALLLPRVAIAGGPRTGKTTLAQDRAAGRLVVHTDDLMGRFEWSALSAEVVRLCSFETEFLVEGVRVAHALRKGLGVDAVVWLESPRVPTTPGQAAMAKATKTVFDEWRRMNIATGRVPVVVM